MSKSNRNRKQRIVGYNIFFKQYTPIRQPAKSMSSSSSWWTLRKTLADILAEEEEGHETTFTTTADNPHAHAHSHRHLSFLDLLSIGIGGTIGSGIFVLIGQIAQYHAGNATWLSFALAGLAAITSGIGFAELAGRLAVSGSTYAYTYLCWGRYMAILAAACLTLEYMVSGAAVAASWGSKVQDYIQQHDGTTADNDNSSSHGSSSTSHINLFAGLVSGASTLLLLCGVQESKQATHLFTTLKLLLVAFMIVAGGIIVLLHSTNTNHDNTRTINSDTTTATPSTVGSLTGMLRGATSSFFGYLGYDEICCMSAEVKRPRRDLPRAVLGTLALVTLVYVLASLVLTSMMQTAGDKGETTTQDVSNGNTDTYNDNTDEPLWSFPYAFAQNGVNWAAQLTAIGELVTLPVVVWISLLAQPRLTQAMAMDGLLPALFGAQSTNTSNKKTDGNNSNHNDHDDDNDSASTTATTSIVGHELFYGTLICGSIMTLTATFVPFTYLDDLISSGILVAFNMTNSCVILMKCQQPSFPAIAVGETDRMTSDRRLGVLSAYVRGVVRRPFTSLQGVLLLYNALCFVTTVLWSHSLGGGGWLQLGFAIATMLIAAGCVLYMSIYCPRSDHFGASILSPQETVALEQQQDHMEQVQSSHTKDIGKRPFRELAADERQSDGRQNTPNNPLPRDAALESSFHYFETPFVPYVPCAGMLINWYLVAQLEVSGILLLVMYLSLVLGIYALYRSFCLTNSTRRPSGDYAMVHPNDHIEESFEDDPSSSAQSSEIAMTELS